MKAKFSIQALFFALACMTLMGPGCSQSSNTAVDPDTAFQQNLSSNITAAGGQYHLSWNLPFGGGPLNSSQNYIYTSQSGFPEMNCQSPQIITPFESSLARSLNIPKLSPIRILLDGQILLGSPKGTFQLTCTANGFRKDFLADDEQTILYSLNQSHFTTVPLSGMMANASVELQAAVPVERWIEANYLSANAQWISGSSYIRYDSTYSGANILVEDCAPAEATTGNTPAPCASGGATLEAIFPYEDYPDSKPSEFDQLADGQISTVQGLRMWTASTALPETAGTVFRVFFELNGNVYAGISYLDGAKALSSQTNGSFVDYSIGLNPSAILSIANHFISAGTDGSGAGIDSALNQTTDLFGIGGHGINGSLAPQDLAEHYSTPAGLDGSGQTIAIVDAPASGDLYGDLNVMSDFYGLPKLVPCPSTTAPCYQHIDLSNGAPVGKNDWGSEPALDLQAAHAMAPKANLVLVTAADFSANAMMAAILRATKIPNVTVISMSFNNLYTDASTFDAMVSSAPGIAFVASSGDRGDQESTGFPGTSPYVTTVGGTRIQALQWTAPSSETAWLFSTGGTLQPEAMPAWQQSFLTPTQNMLNAGMRAIPDVAAVADFQHSPFAIYYKQRWAMSGGTSLAAPVWAGVTALIGQAMMNQKQIPLASALIAASPGGGGYNQMLYAAKTAAGTGVFHDVTSGSDNLYGVECDLCSTGPGFNDVTGLGTPNVSALITQLISQTQ